MCNGDLVNAGMRKHVHPAENWIRRSIATYKKRGVEWYMYIEHSKKPPNTLTIGKKRRRKACNNTSNQLPTGNTSQNRREKTPTTTSTTTELATMKAPTTNECNDNFTFHDLHSQSSFFYYSARSKRMSHAAKTPTANRKLAIHLARRWR